MKPELLYLSENLAQASEAGNNLASSIERCKNFVFNNSYSENELVELEALTSRFARVSDLLIQRTFKTIDQIEGATPGTVRDRLLNAEKKGLIDNTDDFMQIRNVRNTIAHEYEMDALKDLFLFAFKNANLLLECIKTAKQYSLKFYAD